MVLCVLMLWLLMLWVLVLWAVGWVCAGSPPPPTVSSCSADPPLCARPQPTCHPQPEDHSGHRIMLTVGGEGFNAIHDVLLPYVEPALASASAAPVKVVPTGFLPTAAASPLGFLRLSKSQRLLLSGGFDGAACVRPMKEPGWFARAGVHDGDNGRVAAVATSFDDTFMLSAGHDGVIVVLLLRVDELEAEAAAAAATGEPVTLEHLFAPAGTPGAAAVGALAPSEAILAGASDADTAHYVPTTVAELQAMVAVPLEVPASSRPSDVHEEAKEEALVPAPDIVDPAAYSIQDAKLKTEEDKRAVVATQRKNKMREAIRVRAVCAWAGLELRVLVCAYVLFVCVCVCVSFIACKCFSCDRSASACFAGVACPTVPTRVRLPFRLRACHPAPRACFAYPPPPRSCNCYSRRSVRRTTWKATPGAA